MAGETGTSLPADLEATGVAVSVATAAVLGAYAAWITADLLPRWVAFGLVAVVAGYLLAGKPTNRARLRYAADTFAGLLLLTPVLVVLPDALGADRMGVDAVSLVATTANAILFVAFAILAAVVAAVGHLLGER